MDKFLLYNTLDMTYHLNASTYQKADSDSNKRDFNSLKFLINKRILFNQE